MKITNYWSGSFPPPEKTNPRWRRKTGNRPRRYKSKPSPPPPPIDMSKVRAALKQLSSN